MNMVVIVILITVIIAAIKMNTSHVRVSNVIHSIRTFSKVIF